MEQYLLSRFDSIIFAVELIYNYLDTELVIDNDIFYFSPYGEDESMPSLWLKKEDVIVSWYGDKPERGASSNVPSNSENAFLILDTIRGYYGTNTRGAQAKSEGQKPSKPVRGNLRAV